MKRKLRDRVPERERKASEIGELIMNRLAPLRQSCLRRFASVYLDFKDVQEFMEELKDLVKSKETAEVRKVLTKI